MGPGPLQKLNVTAVLGLRLRAPADAASRGHFGRGRRLAVLPGRGCARLASGQRVFHNKFGEGKVLTLEGAGDDARAQIDFPRHGVKWLALSVAKLTPI